MPTNTACLCTGACMTAGGSCIAYPNGRPAYKFQTIISKSEIEILSERLESLELKVASLSLNTKKLYICKECGFHRFMIYAQDDKIIGECEKCKTEWVD